MTLKAWRVLGGHERLATYFWLIQVPGFSIAIHLLLGFNHSRREWDNSTANANHVFISIFHTMNGHTNSKGLRGDYNIG